ncbi:hypothetical protein QOT17_009046 [Balamuthia mandrillaris]
MGKWKSYSVPPPPLDTVCSFGEEANDPSDGWTSSWLWNGLMHCLFMLTFLLSFLFLDAEDFHSVAWLDPKRRKEVERERERGVVAALVNNSNEAAGQEQCEKERGRREQMKQKQGDSSREPSIDALKKGSAPKRKRRREGGKEAPSHLHGHHSPSHAVPRRRYHRYSSTSSYFLFSAFSLSSFLWFCLLLCTITLSLTPSTPSFFVLPSTLSSLFFLAPLSSSATQQHYPVMAAPVLLANAQQVEPPTDLPSGPQHLNQVNLLWWEPDSEKEAPATAPSAADFHQGFFDHFVHSEEFGEPLPQSGVRKITHVAASHRSADLYEFVPESRRVVRRGEAVGGTDTGTQYPNTHFQVAIIPPFLDFKERPVCMPAVESISIINTSERDGLHLFSIASESVHFHSSYFKQSVIPPLGNTTVSIVFLPRTVGVVENDIILQSSVGNVAYRVYGQGVQNPYKLQPFVGVKVPADVTYSPPIEMYNPNDEPLQIKEVFTSGGFLHLTLPKGEDPHTIWTIQPHTKKPIVKLAFVSQQPGKYTGYVNIKTDQDNMILHVDVLVVKGGLHRTPEELDFATLTSTSDQRQTSLVLLNSGDSPVQVSEIFPLTPDPHLQVDFTRTVIPPASEKQIATFTYSGRNEGQFTGKLLLRTNDTNPANARMEIPYKARVLHGSLGYHPLNTTFSVGKPPFEPVVQSLVFTNKFSVPLVFYSAEIEDPNFEVVNFRPGTTAQPGASWPPVTISFLANSTDMMYSTELALSTNASVIRIPLYCYHGRLTYSVTDASDPEILSNDKIDFGMLGVNEIRSRSFNLTNPNPVRVAIYSLHTDIDGLLIKLDSVWNSNGYAMHTGSGRGEISNSRPTLNNNPSKQEQPFLVLEPGNSAIFTAELSSSREEQKTGSILVKTPYENLSIPVNFHSVQGSLTITPPLIRYDQPAFPGRVLNKTISAKSTYGRAIQILSVTTSDPRLVPILTHNTLEPNTKVEIGYILFDPSKVPAEDNYLSELDTSAQTELSKFREPLNRQDLQALQRREQIWKRLTENEEASNGIVEVRGSLTVNTDVIMGYTLAIRAQLVKPSVVTTPTIDFSLTQVGFAAQHNIGLVNPSDHPLHVQLLPLPEQNPGTSLEEGEEDETLMPVSPTASSFYLPPAALEERIVPPHTVIDLGPIFFNPLNLEKMNVTLYVKNNLTIVDNILLIGEGGSGRLQFFEERKGELDELLFALDRSLLSHCTSNDPSVFERKEVKVTKKFVATNVGNLPLDIESIGIQGYKCRGYGFEVQECGSRSLKPGEQLELTITFRPDFSSSLVRRELTVETVQGDYTFSLVATLPYDLLPLCVDSQPHTQLEETIKNTVKGFMVIMFVIMSVIIIKEYFPPEANKQFSISAKFAYDNGESSLPTSNTFSSSPSILASSFSHQLSCKPHNHSHYPTPNAHQSTTSASTSPVTPESCATTGPGKPPHNTAPSKNKSQPANKNNNSSVTLREDVERVLGLASITELPPSATSPSNPPSALPSNTSTSTKPQQRKSKQDNESSSRGSAKSASAAHSVPTNAAKDAPNNTKQQPSARKKGGASPPAEDNKASPDNGTAQQVTFDSSAKSPYSSNVPAPKAQQQQTEKALAAARRTRSKSDNHKGPVTNPPDSKAASTFRSQKDVALDSSAAATATATTVNGHVVAQKVAGKKHKKQPQQPQQLQQPQPQQHLASARPASSGFAPVPILHPPKSQVDADREKERERAKREMERRKEEQVQQLHQQQLLRKLELEAKARSAASSGNKGNAAQATPPFAALPKSSGKPSKTKLPSKPSVVLPPSQVPPASVRGVNLSSQHIMKTPTASSGRSHTPPNDTTNSFGSSKLGGLPGHKTSASFDHKPSSRGKDEDNRIKEQKEKGRELLRLIQGGAGNDVSHHASAKDGPAPSSWASGCWPKDAPTKSAESGSGVCKDRRMPQGLMPATPLSHLSSDGLLPTPSLPLMGGNRPTATLPSPSSPAGLGVMDTLGDEPHQSARKPNHPGVIGSRNRSNSGLASFSSSASFNSNNSAMSAPIGIMKEPTTAMKYGRSAAIDKFKKAGDREIASSPPATPIWDMFDSSTPSHHSNRVERSGSYHDHHHYHRHDISRGVSLAAPGAGTETGGGAGGLFAQPPTRSYSVPPATDSVETLHDHVSSSSQYSHHNALALGWGTADSLFSRSQFPQSSPSSTSPSPPSSPLSSLSSSASSLPPLGYQSGSCSSSTSASMGSLPTFFNSGAGAVGSPPTYSAASSSASPATSPSSYRRRMTDGDASYLPSSSTNISSTLACTAVTRPSTFSPPHPPPISPPQTNAQLQSPMTQEGTAASAAALQMPMLLGSASYDLFQGYHHPFPMGGGLTPFYTALPSSATSASVSTTSVVASTANNNAPGGSKPHSHQHPDPHHHHDVDELVDFEQHSDLVKESAPFFPSFFSAFQPPLPAPYADEENEAAAVPISYEFKFE